MSPVVPLLLAAAVMTWGPGRASAADRLARPQPEPAAPDPADPPGRVRRWMLAGVAGLLVPVLTGPGPGALLLGTAVAVGVDRLLRRTGPRADDGAARVRLDLPVAADLLAVCLAGGTPVVSAVAAVGAAVDGPLGRGLVEVAGRLRLGAAARTAWADLPAPAAGLARAVVRSGESGSAVVPALQRLAEDSRSTARADTAAAVQRAGVWVLAPLGLCFLPAFLCLGVAPLVLGIATDVFG